MSLWPKVSYYQLELGQTELVHLWELTHIFENTAALTASGSFRWCQRQRVNKEQQLGRKRERWWKTEMQTGSSISVFMAGFSSPIRLCLIFFTSHLPFSAANVSHTAGGKWHNCWRRAGQSLTHTLRLRMHAHALTRSPAKLQAKTSFFNCYMGESDVSFSFYHTVMSIIITVGHKFTALLMACMEKNKSFYHKLPVE